MSTRPLIKPYSVITVGNMASASITSSVTIIQSLSMLSYAYSWSGTSPVGTIKVQVSNDYSVDPAGAVKNSGTWNDMTFTSAGSSVSSLAVSGNTGNGFIDMSNLSGYALRTVYTKTSGTGTLQCVLNAKVA